MSQTRTTEVHKLTLKLTNEALEKGTLELLDETEQIFTNTMSEVETNLNILNKQIKGLNEDSQKIARDLITSYNNLLKKISEFSLRQKRIINQIIFKIKFGGSCVNLVKNLDFDVILELHKDIGTLQTEINNKVHKLEAGKRKLIDWKTLLITSLVGGAGAALAVASLGLALPIEIVIASGVIGLVGYSTAFVRSVMQSMVLADIALKNAEFVKKNMEAIQQHLKDIKAQLETVESDMEGFLEEKISIEHCLKAKKSFRNLDNLISKQILIQ